MARGGYSVEVFAGLEELGIILRHERLLCRLQFVQIIVNVLCDLPELFAGGSGQNVRDKGGLVKL